MDKTLILNRFKKAKNIDTDTDLAKFLGINKSTLSNWYSRNSLDYDLLFSKSEQINTNWLLTGEGEMLKPQDIVNERQQSYSIGNIQEDSEGVPLIPIDAMAGFGEGPMQVMQYDLDRYKVPEFTELNVDFMIRVKGSSMYPKYNSGDLVACKKLSIKDLFFQWNKVYVLDTEQGALIKRIKKSDTDNCIKIVSDNPNYDPFDMPLDKIFAISIVVGVIRLE